MVMSVPGFVLRGYVRVRYSPKRLFYVELSRFVDFMLISCI